MEFTTSWQGRVLVGTLKGELGFRDQVAFDRAIDEWTKADASALVLNLADLVYVASVGIGLLMKLAKSLKERGLSIRLAAPRPGIKMLLEMVRADAILPMDPSLEESLQRSAA